MAQTDTYTLTRTEIITAALRKLGVLEAGESASTSQLADGVQALSLLFKELNHMSACRWLIASTTLDLANATYSYGSADGLANNIHEILYVSYRDSTAVESPVEIVDPIRYASITSKTAAGAITTLLFNRHETLSSQTITVCPAPATVTTEKLFYAYEATIQVPGAASDTLDLPMGWQRYALLRLTSDLAHEYGVGVNEIGVIESKADKAFQFLLMDSRAHYTKVAEKGFKA
jgi:hypothetical protein